SAFGQPLSLSAYGPVYADPGFGEQVQKSIDVVHTPSVEPQDGGAFTEVRDDRSVVADANEGRRRLGSTLRFSR
ncbi:MAG TPA: hypothetical protein VJ884_01265, partial [Salinibacter sp.]|nr:hypothetical protein [Salinibacter sp.]